MFKVISKNTQISYENKNRGVALGVFDGLHLGHKELINELVFESLKLDLKPCAYTFVKDNSYEFKKKNKISNGFIATTEDRIKQLQNGGVKEVIVQSFSKEFANMSATDFLDKVLFEELKVRLIVVGFNYRFGKGAAGDVELIKKWGKTKNVKVIVLEPVKYGEEPISSSRIRKLIKAGKVDTVNAMLGRKYSIFGKVISGQQLGRTIGFPTANIKVDENLAMLKKGVYVTKVKVDDRVFESITNIGTRPSVEGSDDQIYAETLIFDVELNLYDKYLEIYFLKFMRPEKKFDSIDDLKNNIEKDIAKCRSNLIKLEDFSLLAKVNTTNIYSLKSDRFSTASLEISFKLPATKELAAINNLLCSVMTATCKKYPKRPILSRRLDELYGAYADYSVDVFGDMHISTFTVDALAEFKDIRPFDDAVELLFEIIANPDIDENGLFKEEIVKSQAVGIISDIMARKNDKQKYAFDKGLSEYTKDTNYGIRSFGDIESMKKIEPKDLKEAYKRLLNDAEISIFLFGNYSTENVENIISKVKTLFKNNKIKKENEPVIFPKPFYVNTKKQEKVEKLKIGQSKLCMFYKCPVNYYSSKTVDFGIMNLMLGGDVHSLLFQEVREKMGLAYSIYSAPMKYLSTIVMVAGVAHEKLDVAKQAMASQLDAIASGNFQDDVFDSSIVTANYANNAIADNLHSMIRYYSNNLIKGIIINLSNANNYINSIKKEDVIKIAQKSELVTVYKITGLQGE